MACPHHPPVHSVEQICPLCGHRRRTAEDRFDARQGVGAARWIRAAIAPLGPLVGPLAALLLPQTANPYPLYRAVVTEHAIL
jgi:hypothetical protein